MSNTDDTLRYPVGKFVPQETYSQNEINDCIARIEALPAKFEYAANRLSAKQLDTPYREGGWTARQVIHHLADSHMNALIRIKWTITEETPTIKAYDEKLWAETAEVSLAPEMSINLVKAIHVKMVALMKTLSPEQLQKQFLHPETKKHVAINRMIALYAWHGEHHLGHLEIVLRK